MSWYCANCREEIIPTRVTYQERHDSCGFPCAWIEDEDFNPDSLSELIEAEKDGRLVVLPCKVGKTVYWADNIVGTPEILQGQIASFSIDNKKGDLWAFIRYDCGLNYHHKVCEYFGKTVFLTKEAALSALEVE